MGTSKMTAHGIEWTYARNVVYTGQYCGFEITVRRVGALSAETGKPWRLNVRRGRGGNLSFSHQFWPTAESARLEGMRIVNEQTKSDADLRVKVSLILEYARAEVRAKRLQDDPEPEDR